MASQALEREAVESLKMMRNPLGASFSACRFPSVFVVAKYLGRKKWLNARAITRPNNLRREKNVVKYEVRCPWPSTVEPLVEIYAKESSMKCLSNHPGNFSISFFGHSHFKILHICAVIFSVFSSERLKNPKRQ